MIQDAFTLAGLAADLDRFGVELPPTAAGALATWQAAQQAAHRDVTADLAAAVEAGQIDASTVADAVTAAAAALAAKEYAGRVAASLERPVLRAATAAIVEHFDDLIAALRPHFAEAGDRLKASLDVLGDEPDARIAIAGGPALAQAFESYRSSVKVLDQVAAVRRTLAEAERGPRISNDVPGTWYIVAAPTMARIEEAARCRRWPEYLAAGFELHLNDRSEAAQLLAAAQAGTQAILTAEQAAEAARRAEAAADFDRRWGRLVPGAESARKAPAPRR